MMMKLSCFIASCMIVTTSVFATTNNELRREQVLSDQQQVADYIEQYVVGQNYTSETVWMTDTAVPGDASSNASIVRDPDLGGSDDLLPYPLTWVVMLDEQPRMTFGHRVRWIYVSQTLEPGAHVVVNRQFPPIVLANLGAGPRLNFSCKAVTPVGCPVYQMEDEAPLDEAFLAAAEEAAAAADDKNCLYAVLISGDGDPVSQANIMSMYMKLRDCGYPEDHIYTFYTNNPFLDLDGDGDDDINGGSATTDNVSTKIKDLCKNLNLDKDRDVLFIYTTGHGSNAGALLLWEADTYTPTELAADTVDCEVCRLYIVMDQCYSGAFIDLATDGDHANTVVTTATASNEIAWCRRYTENWCDEDIGESTINEIVAAVSLDMMGVRKSCTGGANFCKNCTDDADCPPDAEGNTGECLDELDDGDGCGPDGCGPDGPSTPQAGEGTDGNGNSSICDCWETSGPGPTPAPSTVAPSYENSGPGPTPVPSTVAPTYANSGPGPTTPSPSSVDGAAPSPAPSVFSATTKSPTPGGFGEPHFKTWRGHRFDYHGECDLVLLRSTTFASGKGIEIIIRTKIAHPRAYSYIASAVVKIGTDILQVDGFGVYYFNGKESAELPDNIAGFPLTYTQTEKKRHIFDLNLHDHEYHHILLREFKGFISVNVDQVGEYFHDCTGLLGSFETGEMLARDGTTAMSKADPVAFGQEWQVLDTESMNFQTARFPQYPERCLMADPAQVARRRLEATDITHEQAEEACAHLAQEDRADCVFDVLETGDLDMALEDALNGGSDRLDMIRETSVF